MADDAARSELTVSVVVVAFQQRDALLECLDSCLVAGQAVDGGSELIVVDNGELSELVRQRCPQAVILKPGFNSGFAGAVNRAVQVAQGRWIALVNDDARIEPESLTALIGRGESAPRIGSVASQVRFMSRPDRINSAGISVDRFGIATERLVGAPADAAQDPAEVFGATGCFAAYRRAMLEELGGFDERFFAYLEDVDLAWRARAAGWYCFYEPRAVAFHHGSATSGDASPTKFFLVGRNRVWLLARNATRGQLLSGLPGILLYDAAYVFYVALLYRTIAPLRGRLAGLRSAIKMRSEVASRRRVELDRPGWMDALRMHLAYRSVGGPVKST